MQTENLLDKLFQHSKQELPYVVYRKPVQSASRTQEMVKVMLQRNQEYYGVNHYSESGFVFAPFDSREQAVLIPTSQSGTYRISPENFVQEVSKVTGVTRDQKDAMSDSFLDKVQPPGLGKSAHIKLVSRAVEVLRSNELDKVILSRREEVPVSKGPLELLSAMLEAYPTAFVYCWYHPKTGLWLGATPETLVHLKGKQFETMAFAGTQVFKGDMRVEWGQKELQEQQYVTDSILENLRALGLAPEIQPYDGQERVGDRGTYSSRAGNLLHLRTDITGKVKSENELASIIKALHPTPAVGGLPKEAARDYILKEEPYDREFYTGFLGELNLEEHQPRARSRRNVENLAYGTLRKQSALYVNLRCMKLEGRQAVIFVGGGITSESDSQAEWEETVNKSETMKRVLW